MGLMRVVLFKTQKMKEDSGPASAALRSGARSAAQGSFRFVLRTINEAQRPTNRYKRFDLECPRLAVE